MRAFHEYNFAMLSLSPLEPVDYLVFGHLTLDETPQGFTLGGSAAYAALTAAALGLRPGIVTAWGQEIPLTALQNLPIVALPAPHSTAFRNQSTPQGRRQTLLQLAPPLDPAITPQPWRRAKIMHLAPVANETPQTLPDDFHPALLGVTPQGFLRAWEEDGLIRPRAWLPAEEASRPGALVLSLEDVAADEERVDALAHLVPLLVITEGAAGCRVFWHGDSRRLRAPRVNEVDPTGAGDVFAASFFIRLLQTRDPWEAARFASQAAAICVTRPGLQGVPTPLEMQRCAQEVLTV